MESTVGNPEGQGPRASTIPKATCGVGSCKPSSVQCLANMKAFTANIGLIFFVQVASMTYMIGTIRTVEKRFSLRSQQMGVLSSLGDVVQVLLVLVIGYFARKAHKPRYLSISIIIFSIGIFLSAMPYFIFGTKEDLVISALAKNNRTQNGGLCTHDETPSCRASDDQTLNDSNDVAYIFFILSALVAGFGGAAVQIMGISYLDENLAKKDSAIYIAAATVMYPVGPIFGFLLAALATSVPENLTDSVLSNTDPAFIGAWWLGYVVFPCMTILFAVPLFFFPKHFPEYYKQKHARMREKNELIKKVDDHLEKKSVIKMIWGEIKSFPSHLFKLLSKPEFVTQILSNIFGLYMLVGVFANFARYAEIHFLQPAFYANIFAAVSTAGAGAIGNLAGGIIMKKFHVGVEGAAKMHAVTSLSAIIGVIIMMLIPCNQIKLAGETTNTGMIDVDMSCSTNCSCSMDYFIPVCGRKSALTEEKITYMSPCHAGCQGKINSGVNSIYTNCSCLPPAFNTATNGKCEDSCSTVYIYVATMFVMGIVGGSGRVPATIVTLRIVDPEMKTFALGLMSFLVNLLAFIPGPIIFGSLQDSTCLVWSENCGKTGNCIFYDTAKYRHFNHGVSLVFVGVGFMFVVATWLLIKRAVAQGKYRDPPAKTPDGSLDSVGNSVDEEVKTLPETKIIPAPNSQVQDSNDIGVMKRTKL